MDLTELEPYVKNGDIPALKLAVVTIRLGQYSWGYIMEGLLKMALAAKQMDVIVWCWSEYFNRNTLKQDLCSLAIYHGDLESLRFLHEDQQQPLPIQACSTAAWVNDVQQLKYLHERGCPLTLQTMLMVMNGMIMEEEDYVDRTPVLQYLYDHNCPWNNMCARQAIYSRNADVLKFLHTHGCPWDEEVIECAIDMKNIAGLRYAYENGCPYYTDTEHTIIQMLNETE